MTIQVNPLVSPRIITIPETDGTSITIQSLVNQIRNWEDNQVNLCYPRLLSAAGKEVLSDIESVGITAKLENTKVKFADRTSETVCGVTGGNLVAVNESGIPIDAIAFSTNVVVMLKSSSSATLVQSADITAIKAKTDNLPTYVAEETSVQTLLYRIGIPTSPSISDDLDVINARTSKIPDSPAISGEYNSTLSTINTAIDSRASQTSMNARPTLSSIEGSTVLAKEATINTKASQSSVDGKPSLGQMEASSVLAKEATINTKANQSTADSIKTKTDTIVWGDVGFIKQVEQGRWRITGNQMIIYAADGQTPIATFNCYDGVGNPTVENIYEMRPVT